MIKTGIIKIFVAIVLPAAGFRHGSGDFMNLGESACFWSASENGYGWMRGLEYNFSGINRDYSGFYRGYSVRCIKDK
jgi:uncharacterized protein (TIGR02145 family)